MKTLHVFYWQLLRNHNVRTIPCTHKSVSSICKHIPQGIPSALPVKQHFNFPLPVSCVQVFWIWHSVSMNWVFMKYYLTLSHLFNWVLLSLCPSLGKRWMNEKKSKHHSLNVLNRRCPEITECANLTVGTSSAYVFLKVIIIISFIIYCNAEITYLYFLRRLKCVTAMYPLPLQYWKRENFCCPFCKFVLTQNYSYLLKWL